MKKKSFFTITMSLILVFITSISALAYQFNYSTLPSNYQTKIDSAYVYNYPDEGPDRMSIDSWRALLSIFPTSSSPVWSNISSFRATGLADQSDASYYFNQSWVAAAARCIFAENVNVGTGTEQQNSMCATADVISNRSRYSSYGGSISGAVLKPGAFSSMRDLSYAARNPLFYDDSADALGYAVMIASHMSEDGDALYILSDKYFHFYDISVGMPFYKKINGIFTQCTTSNVTTATYYKSGSTYYPIKADAPPVKYATHVYFSY